MSLTTQELRLFLEELCCELFRFLHMAEADLPPEALRIEREYPLAPSGPYADVHVCTAPTHHGPAPYFIEIKFAVPDDEVLSRLRLKYGRTLPGHSPATRLIVVLDLQNRSDPAGLVRAIREAVVPALSVEIWDEPRLLSEVERIFHVRAPALDEAHLLDMRDAIQREMARYAFSTPARAAAPLPDGSRPPVEPPPILDSVKEQLLWRFAFWRLRQIRQAGNLSPRQILPPGTYPGVAVVIADLCSFSSYVRDTPDDPIVRDCLTSFYSKARYEVVNRGGMVENFVGDQILALFGVPDRCPGYVEHALQAAQALLSVGEAVSDYWQRQIDRQQPSSGMHIGVAFGDLQIVALRPSCRSNSTAIADVINVAARLMNMAAPGEILVANSFHKQLSTATRAPLIPVAPQDARNVGRLRAWRLPTPDSTSPTRPPVAPTQATSEAPGPPHGHTP